MPQSSEGTTKPLIRPVAVDLPNAEEAIQLTTISPEPAVTSDSPPRVKPQIPVIPKSLFSQVDETLRECPR